MQPDVFCAAAGEEMPLIKELWLHFYEKYITSDQVYPSLGIDADNLLSIRIIIIGLFIGLAIASFGAVFNKRVLGAFVRKLISEGALDADNAKTLDELGFGANVFVRTSIGHGYNLKRIVVCREEQLFYEELAKQREEYQKKREEDPSLPRFQEVEYKVDVINDSFYIPEEKKYEAEVKFEKKGTSFGGAVFILILMIIAMAALLIALPQILEFIDGIVESFKQSTGINGTNKPGRW